VYFLKKEITTYLPTLGALLSSFSLLGSVLLGFGGFNLLDFFSYSISGFVSRPQIIFLTFTSMSFFILSINWHKQFQPFNNHKFVLASYLLVTLAFSITAIIGLTSQMRNPDFWAQTNFVETNITLLFNNLSLLCFLSLGILQMTLSVFFFKNKLNNKKYLTKTNKSVILISGILFLIKTILDYPILKEAIFILSFMAKIPIPNNIISLLSPLIFLIAQIQLAIALTKN